MTAVELLVLLRLVCTRIVSKFLSLRILWTSRIARSPNQLPECEQIRISRAHAEWQRDLGRSLPQGIERTR